MTAPSHAVKAALKAALRRAPGGPRGRHISNFSVPQLREIAVKLGLDVAQIERDALAGLHAGHTGVYTPMDTEDAPDNGVDLSPDTVTDTKTDAEETAIDREVSDIARLVGQGGFVALDKRLRELVREARKPPIVQEIRVEIPVDSKGNAAPVICAKPTNTDKTWAELFGVKGPLGQRVTRLWDGAHPDTPEVNKRYIFPDVATKMALTQIARKRNVFLFGPKGTGKTEWATQLAARCGRPLAVISCDNGTDAATLVGMTIPEAGGGTRWQDGQLTRAIRTPGCVVLIDEPSVARPGALMVMQNMLANRVLWHAETGLRVPVAQGVLFVAPDNTNGTGGGGRRGYTDTNTINTAYMDRFGVIVDFSYLPRDQEIRALVGYTGCTKELAALLVDCADTTRASAANAVLTEGISFRRLISWAELLTDGVDPADAFRGAVLNGAKAQDVEAIRQQCMLGYDMSAIGRALNPLAATVNTPATPDPVDDNPTIAGRDAARDFTAV